MRITIDRILVVAMMLVAGCQQLIIDRTDRAVYRVIEERQRDALGATSDVNIGREAGQISPNDSMYSFVPHPTDPTLPESFQW